MGRWGEGAKGRRDEGTKGQESEGVQRRRGEGWLSVIENAVFGRNSEHVL